MNSITLQLNLQSIKQFFKSIRDAVLYFDPLGLLPFSPSFLEPVFLLLAKQMITINYTLEIWSSLSMKCSQSMSMRPAKIMKAKRVEGRCAVWTPHQVEKALGVAPLLLFLLLFILFNFFLRAHTHTKKRRRKEEQLDRQQQQDEEREEENGNGKEIERWATKINVLI